MSRICCYNPINALRFIYITIFLSVFGCAAAPPPNAAEINDAFTAVWEGKYNQPKETRPSVSFDLPDCVDEYGSGGIMNSLRTCLLGWNGSGGIHVAWFGSFEASAFAHELIHQVIWNETPAWDQERVGGDPWHTLPIWATCPVKFGCPALVAE